MSEWVKFFEGIGIPTNLGLRYAKTFGENRIQRTMLGDLTKELLNELGITAVGDVIAILKKAKTASNEEEEKQTVASLRATSVKKPVATSVTSPNPPTPTPNKKPLKSVTSATATVPTVKKPVKKQDDPSKLQVTIAGTQPVTVPPKKMAAVAPKRKPISIQEPIDKACTTLIKAKVMPKIEGDLKVKMPEGTTERSRHLLKKAAAAQEADKLIVSMKNTTPERKETVFARLGSMAGPKELAETEQPIPKKKAKVTFAPSPSHSESPEVSSTTGVEEGGLEMGSMKSDKIEAELFRKTSALERLGVERPPGSSPPGETGAMGRWKLTVIVGAGENKKSIVSAKTTEQGTKMRLGSRLGPLSTSLSSEPEHPREERRKPLPIRRTISGGSSVSSTSSGLGPDFTIRRTISTKAVPSSEQTIRRLSSSSPQGVRARLGVTPPQTSESAKNVFTRLG